MTAARRELAALVGGLLALLGLVFGANWSALGALSVAIATWVGLRLLLPAGSGHEAGSGPEDVSRDSVLGRLRRAEAAVRGHARRLPEGAAAPARELAAVLADLTRSLERAIGDANAVDSMLENIVERAVAVLDRHAPLLADPGHRELGAAEERIAAMLRRVTAGLEQLRDRRLEADLRELGVDQDVVEELVALEEVSLRGR